MKAKDLHLLTTISLLETFALVMLLSTGRVEGDLPYYALVISTAISIGLFLAMTARQIRERKEKKKQ